MRKARPPVMKQIQTPDPTKLLGGAKYHYLATGWRYATADQDIYMTLHQVRHVIAAILNNSPETVLKTYAFFDRRRAFSAAWKASRT